VNKIIFASAFAAVLVLGTNTGAEARRNYYLSGEIGDPYGCHDCAPNLRAYQGRLSCGEAKARVRRSGFSNVASVECRGGTYTFEATRRGRDVTVIVNSRTGALWRR
jgi:hypothetical protein